MPESGGVPLIRNFCCFCMHGVLSGYKECCARQGSTERKLIDYKRETNKACLADPAMEKHRSKQPESSKSGSWYVAIEERRLGNCQTWGIGNFCPMPAQWAAAVKAAMEKTVR